MELFNNNLISRSRFSEARQSNRAKLSSRCSVTGKYIPIYEAIKLTKGSNLKREEKQTYIGLQL
jgi:hypothetical protein